MRCPHQRSSAGNLAPRWQSSARGIELSLKAASLGPPGHRLFLIDSKKNLTAPGDDRFAPCNRRDDPPSPAGNTRLRALLLEGVEDRGRDQATVGRSAAEAGCPGPRSSDPFYTAREEGFGGRQPPGDQETCGRAGARDRPSSRPAWRRGAEIRAAGRRAISRLLHRKWRNARAAAGTPGVDAAPGSGWGHRLHPRTCGCAAARPGPETEVRRSLEAEVRFPFQ